MASLTSTLYFDFNEDGQINSGDIKLQGWTVGLFATDGTTLVTSDVTDANGVYQFSNVAQGQYIVKIIATDPNEVSLGAYGINDGGFAPSVDGYTYVIPSSPFIGSEVVYPVTLLNNGNQIGGTDFEDADDLLASGGSADDITLTDSNQVWMDIGYKFWWDENQDFIGDALPGESGLAMTLEQRNVPTAIGTTNAQNTDAFVNDYMTGPYDLANRASKRQFDYENGSHVGEMGDYVLRGNGVYNQTTVPTLLIQYTLPTKSASGRIWDIDGAYIIENSVPVYNGSEQWKVEWFDDHDNNPTTAPIKLGEELSPLGQSVWVPQSDINNPVYNDSRASFSTQAPDGRSYAGWYYNPASLDGKYWEWSFDAGAAIVDFVRVSYMGTKTNLPNVGLAFDKFQAFGEASSNADFLVSKNFSLPNASLGDFVWHDLDADGVQDSNEVGINGVTVKLLDSTGAVIGTTQTGDNPNTTGITEQGWYNFGSLLPGTYQVQFSLPTGFDSVSPYLQGGNISLDSNANPSNALTSAPILLGESEINPTIDAGFYQLASLGDYVFIDNNKDGLQDAGDTPLSGVTVELINGDGDVIASTTTNASGGYLFDNLVPGTYQVLFTAPSGYTFTTANAGDDTLDSDADSTGLTQTVTLTSGQFNGTLDAGLLKMVNIGDKVFYDLDKDGIQDSGENGVAGVNVYLLNESGVVIGTDVTDNSGLYLFENVLGNSTYSIKFELSTGFDEFTIANQGANDAVDSDVISFDSLTGLGSTAPFYVGYTDDLTRDAGLIVESAGGEGLTPGFWKNHADINGNKNNAYAWGPTGYAPTNLYETVFGVSLATQLSASAISAIDKDKDGVELLEALEAKGNDQSFQALLRHSTAALLNAAHPGVDYAYGVGTVIDWTQDAFEGSRDPIATKDLFATQNELGAIL